MKTGSADNERVPVMVRLPGHILERIGGSLGQGDVPMSGNDWIIEAPVEKVEAKR